MAVFLFGSLAGVHLRHALLHRHLRLAGGKDLIIQRLIQLLIQLSI